MTSDLRIRRDDSLLLIVDIQRRLAPAVHDRERALARTLALIEAAAHFGIPKLATEHCAERIGVLLQPLRSRLTDEEIFSKTAFAATEHPEFLERVRGHRRQQIVITGMEAHVCVLQTALGLRAAGLDVAIVADACVSRAAAQLDRELAFQRLAQAGCLFTACETLLFEWTHSGTDERFRSILALIKSF